MDLRGRATGKGKGNGKVGKEKENERGWMEENGGKGKERLWCPTHYRSLPVPLPEFISDSAVLCIQFANLKPVSKYVHYLLNNIRY